MSTDSRQERSVSIVRDDDAAGYPSPDDAPFHPSEAWPEFPAGELSPRSNRVFAMIRQSLADLGLDRARFGTPAWNPIGSLVRPGARIVVKPNWVMHNNPGVGGMDCLITHSSILRAVLDYVALARPSDVVVGDAPIQDCDFDALARHGIHSVLEVCRRRGDLVQLKDFRRTSLQQDGHRLSVHEELRPLEEYLEVDLGSRSLLEPISDGAQNFRVTKYDPRKMHRNHRPGVHRYLVARDVLQADLVVNLPKMKTHKKAGVTVSLKNLVGINGNKDFLPHHRKGAATGGGDNYPRFSPLKAAAEALLDLANRNLHRRLINRECNRLVYGLLVSDMKLGGTGDVEGGWYGNDTVWRMCLDLNRVLLYADDQGRLHDTPRRAELSIVDALVAGEGDGPLRPTPRRMGTILASLNPAAVDWISALLMGIDPLRVPIIFQAFAPGDLPIALFEPDQITCTLNGRPETTERVVARAGARFEPAPGWRNHCELRPPP